MPRRVNAPIKKIRIFENLRVHNLNGCPEHGNEKDTKFLLAFNAKLITAMEQFLVRLR